MKIGIGYIYTINKYGYPPKLSDDMKALKEIREMGFHFLEMEGLGNAHTQMVWEKRFEFKKCLDENGIQMHNFCGVDPELVSLDDEKRKAAYRRFERTAELADFLGADTLHLASYAPPVDYIGCAPYQLGEEYNFGDSFRVRIPENFSWEKVWDVLVQSCRRTSEIASAYGKGIIMEPRVGEIICSVDSMIRLINDVNMDNFKANFDTAHFSAQRGKRPSCVI